MVNSEFGGSGIGYISSVRARLTISQDAFRSTLYSTSCVVSRAPRVRRERGLQVLNASQSAISAMAKCRCLCGFPVVTVLYRSVRYI